jgi:ubiquinone/menaquinone biosynthesis C-methylase UbiE
MIERARKRVPSANLVARSATGEGLGLERESFDRVICSEVLEHVPMPEKILINAYEVLKPGGLIAVSVPYRQKLVWMVCTNCGELTTDGHINSFDEEKMASILQDCGFTVISVQGYRIVRTLLSKRISYFWWKNLNYLIIVSER